MTATKNWKDLLVYSIPFVLGAFCIVQGWNIQRVESMQEEIVSLRVAVGKLAIQVEMLAAERR